MKKALVKIGIAVAILAAFLLGRLEGIRHAIEDCEMFITDYGDGTYISIFTDLDGHRFEHIGFIG